MIAAPHLPPPALDPGAGAGVPPGLVVDVGLVRRTMATPVGPLELVASPAGLRAVLWPGEDGSRVRASMAGAAPGDRARSVGHLDRAEEQLSEYLAGGRRTFDLDLDPIGTPFQRRAWEVLARIPFGQTRSYAEQARALGAPSAARAVGAANARNPLSIVVPCHRVVSSSGALTGFAGGLDRKAWLLDHEQHVVATSAP